MAMHGADVRYYQDIIAVSFFSCHFYQTILNSKHNTSSTQKKTRNSVDFNRCKQTILLTKWGVICNAFKKKSNERRETERTDPNSK